MLRQAQLQDIHVAEIDDSVFVNVACIALSVSIAHILYESQRANFLKAFIGRPIEITKYDLILLLL